MSGHAHDGKHIHGVIDPMLVSTARGIRAIKWSFGGLALTAVLQIAVVLLSGSVALFADAIHNVGDAATAVPLWIAFLFARRGPSARFTYGFGRVEDLAGVVIVGVILSSALFAGWQAIERLQDPQPISALGAVAAAGVIGFLGNEAVALLRIRVGKEIGSAALVADGYHARSDGLTSLAVVAGAAGVWLGYPQADPVVGLLISALILGIVWQSGRAVFSRLLDGVDPAIVGEIRHAAEHLDEIRAIAGVRSRWLGHQLIAEVDVVVDGQLSIERGDQIAAAFREEVAKHLPALGTLRVTFASVADKIETRRPTP
jgi:cation diffusion facilitator family transporter